MARIEDVESLRAARDEGRVRFVVAVPLAEIGARIGDLRWIELARSGEGRARA